MRSFSTHRRPPRALLLVGFLAGPALARCENFDFRPGALEGSGGQETATGGKPDTVQGGAAGEPGEGSVGGASGAFPDGPGGNGPSGGSGTSSSGCLESAVKFELRTEPDGVYCVPPCPERWLEISQGTTLFTLEQSCVPRCETCSLAPCPAAPCPASRLLEGALSRPLLGRHFSAGSCGDNFTCETASCLPAGVYSARFCLYVPASDDPGTCEKLRSRECATVEFEWPREDPVQAVLKQPSAR